MGVMAHWSEKMNDTRSRNQIFRATLPVIATNLANQQGNHDIVQLPNSNFHGFFFFLLFFLKNIRLPMFFPLKDWGFPVSEP